MSKVSRMHWPKIETPRLKINADASGPTVIITGVIVSLWTNLLFCMGVSSGFFDETGAFIIAIAFITHVIISISTTVALINGFKDGKCEYLKPWMLLKGIELLALLISIILLCSQYYQRYIGLVPVGVIFLLIGSYILLCVFTAYKRIKDNPKPPSSNLESTVIDKPPSYDSFANQTENDI